MRVILVSGGIHQILTAYLSKKINVINREELELKDLSVFLQETNPDFEAILITDDGFSQHIGHDMQEMNFFFQWLKKENKTGVRVLVITRDFMKETELSEINNSYENLSIKTYDFIRAPWNLYNNALEELVSDKKHVIGRTNKNEKPIEVEKKKSFLDRFRPKPKVESELQATDMLTREIEKISRGISRVIAVTGHRGSGLTSTAVNVAYEASKRGLSAIIVDMDIDYRSTNMYFSNFHEQTKRDEDINASLIRTLARPQDYMTTAFNIKDNLWLTSLGYGFNDRKVIDQFYNNSKLVGLLSVLRNKFNLVILDMPIDLFTKFNETLIHIDVFGLCVPNNLYSVLSTLRNVEVIFDIENASYINSKSRVVVTKYNSRSRFQNEILTPDKLNEVLSSGLSDKFTYEMKLAGYVPYSDEFDAQIETDVLVVNTSTEHEKAFGNILLRLMEGAK